MKRILYIIAFIFTLSTAVSAQEPESQNTSRIVIGGQHFYVHTVQPGETIYSLSRRYGVPQGDITGNNPHIGDALRAGEAIKIPAPEPDPLPRNIRNRTTSNRRVEVHAVNAGETAYSIANRYAVSVDDLIESNPNLDPTKLAIGQRILIPRELIGSSSQSEIEAGFSLYTEALNDVADEWNYHLVEKGEAFYSLTRQLGISKDSLRMYNPAELADGLKAGSILRYPASKKQSAAPQETDRDTGAPVIYERPEAKPFDTSQPLRVALLMPFSSNEQERTSSTDYYNGTLLALQDLKQQGISVNLSVYDTQRSAREVRSILRNDDMENTDLIIGPRFEETFEEASRFAYLERIPIVSPQSQIDTENPFAYQVRPAAEHQLDKLKPFLGPDYNVVFISPSTGVDAAFYAEIEKLLPANARRVSYSGKTSASAIRNALSRDRENIIVVPTESESMTDEILPTISSIQNNMVATTGRGYPLRVIGSPQWVRFRNNDKEQFFKLQVMCVTLYYADRTNPVVAAFDHRYLSAFGTLPSLFSYRGYDVAKIFISAIQTYGRQYAESINRINTGLLQAPYRFRKDSRGKWINDQWVLVQYRNDYTIDVK